MCASESDLRGVPPADTVDAVGVVPVAFVLATMFAVVVVVVVVVTGDGEVCTCVGTCIVSLRVCACVCVGLPASVLEFVFVGVSSTRGSCSVGIGDRV